MLDCKRVLEGAKTELHVLDVKDVQPEKIQLHLSGCMVRFLSFLLTRCCWLEWERCLIVNNSYRYYQAHSLKKCFSFTETLQVTK